MATPITTLELRAVEIPRHPLVEIIEREIGRPLTHEHRHYLANEPVHCGDFLELFEAGKWAVGRYEWTCSPDEPATLHSVDRVISITENCLLRWPK
jgi:hypothetical protein